jgi:hypothetical protein
MRVGAPRRLDDARGLAPLARGVEQTAGERGRRNELRRELHRFRRERFRAFAIGLLGRQRLRREQHCALATIGGLVEQVAPHIVLEPGERAGPVAGGAAEFEHRLPGPGGDRAGVGLRRLLGIGERGGGVVPPLRLDEETMQAERAGVGAPRHLLEGGAGGGAVAGKLRRLRGEEQSERLAGRQAVGLVGEAARGAHVAGADRDQALRHRAIAARVPPRA